MLTRHCIIQGQNGVISLMVYIDRQHLCHLCYVHRLLRRKTISLILPQVSTRTKYINVTSSVFIGSSSVIFVTYIDYRKVKIISNSPCWRYKYLSTRTKYINGSPSVFVGSISVIFVIYV